MIFKTVDHKTIDVQDGSYTSSISRKFQLYKIRLATEDFGHVPSEKNSAS